MTHLFHYHGHAPEIVLPLPILFFCLTLSPASVAVVKPLTGSRLPSLLFLFLPEKLADCSLRARRAEAMKYDCMTVAHVVSQHIMT